MKKTQIEINIFFRPENRRALLLFFVQYRVPLLFRRITGSLLLLFVVGCSPSFPELHSSIVTYLLVATYNNPALVVTSGPSTLQEVQRNGYFQVKLASPPAGVVNVPVQSSDTTEATVSTPMLSFNTSNWNKNQKVDVLSKDDLDRDGDIPVAVVIGPSVSSDPGYANLSQSLNFLNLDNDRFTFILSSTTTGFIGAAGGVQEADNLCNAEVLNKPSLFNAGQAGYRALIVDGPIRRAAVSPNAIVGGTSEQRDWVLQPFTAYFRWINASADYTFASGANNIFRTDANGLFDFSSFSLFNSTSIAANYYWTGLNADWTTAIARCGPPGAEWKDGTVIQNGSIGDASQTDGRSISTIVPSTCAVPRALLCVEQ